MKYMLALITAAALITFAAMPAAHAQAGATEKSTSTNTAASVAELPPGAPPLITNTTSFLQLAYDEITNGGTNFLILPYATYSPSLPKNDRLGGGLAVMWPLHQGAINAWAGPRVEYFDGGVWTLSGTATINAPLRPIAAWPGFVVDPFIYAGVGAKYGHSDNAIAITGEGATIGWKLSPNVHLNIVGSREQRTSFGYSYCVGPAIDITW